MWAGKEPTTLESFIARTSRDEIDSSCKTRQPHVEELHMGCGSSTAKAQVCKLKEKLCIGEGLHPESIFVYQAPKS